MKKLICGGYQHLDVFLRPHNALDDAAPLYRIVSNDYESFVVQAGPGEDLSTVVGSELVGVSAAAAALGATT